MHPLIQAWDLFLELKDGVWSLLSLLPFSLLIPTFISRLHQENAPQATFSLLLST